MLTVPVLVPEDRVMDFYHMFTTWLGGTPSTLNQGTEAPPEPSGWDLPAWSSEDTDQARQVWVKLSKSAQRLFSVLIDAPEEKFSGDELADRAGIPNGKQGLAGALGWPGRHSFAAGRRWFWSWDYPDGNAVYWLTSEVAAVFRQARDSSNG